MKLSLSLFVIALALSATTAAYGAESVTGAVDENGNPCGEFDSNCTGEYDVPGGDGGGPPAPENICPSVPSGKCDDKLEGVTCVNKTDNTRWKCTNGVFVVNNNDVGAAFTDPPAASPTGCDGTAKDCSGEAVIVFSKDSEESDVADIDVDSMELDDSAAALSTTIVSSIIGFTAIAGVVALL
jgi:hypothetical protein